MSQVLTLSLDEPPISVCLPASVGQGVCSLCGGEITEVRRVGHWRESGGTGGYWYAGRCPHCDVDFRMHRPSSSGQGSEPPAWYPEAPEPEWLGEPLLPAQLYEVGWKVSQEPGLWGEWREFIGRARAGDGYCWYSIPGSGDVELPAPVARIRDGKPVAWFSPGCNFRLLEAPRARAQEAAQVAQGQARLGRRRLKARERRR